MQGKDNREYYVDNCESDRKADELLYLLDMAADGMSGLSERERLRLLVMMEEDALDGSPVYNRWFERRRGEAALSSDAEEADPADMERIIRNTMLHIRREKSRMKLRRTFISVAKIAALFVFAAFSIITYEYIKQLSSRDENEILMDRMAEARRIMQSGLAENTVQEYFSPRGSRSRIVLKDSSVVWLNSDSRLLVNSDFGDSIRLTSLEGHALFDVRKNEAVPFHVIVGNRMNIRVTGTQFSVNAYKDAEYIETVLVDGSIDVESKGRVVKMSPSDKLLIDNVSDRMTLSRVVKEEKYVVWKDGILIFEETPMDEVISSLEKWFNVTIHIDNPEVLAYRITAKLDNLSLEQVMNNLSYVSNLKYKIDKREVWLM